VTGLADDLAVERSSEAVTDMIDSSLASFFEDGLGLHIGTRNDRLAPTGARALAIRVEPDGAHVLLYLAAAAALRILPDLRHNGAAAVTCARPTDDRACQIKGTFVDVRPATTEDRAVMDAKWMLFLDNLERIGVSRQGVRDWVTWPALVIRLRVTAVFDQTPGKTAGAQLS
jgi:hypothetical protein